MNATNGRHSDGLADAVRAYVASDAVAAFELVLGSPPVAVPYGKKGEVYWPCRFHNDTHPSFRLNPGKQSWWCDPCTFGGDIFDLVERLNSCTFPGALRWLAERFNLNGNGYNGSSTTKRPKSNREHASAICAASSPAKGTITETYLRARGILGEISPSVRHHPKLKHGPTNQDLPAMVVAVTNESGEVCAVHRTYLKPDGSGKAEVDRHQQKLALGPIMNGCARFSPVTSRVAYTEGVEDALTIEQALRIPARATLGSFRTPIVDDSVAEVYFCADRDPTGKSERDARKAGARLLVEKPQLRVFLTLPSPRPDGTKVDFNQLLMERGDEGVREEFDAGLEQLTLPTCSSTVIYKPPSASFIFDKYDADAMLDEVLRRFAYLKELDNVADLDDCLIRGQDGFASYAAKYNAFEPDPIKPNAWRKVSTPVRWRECPERIELVKPVYEPGLPSPICEIDGRAYFNQWRGFAAEPKEGDISRLTKILDHVYEELPDEKRHFLRFHAYARQHPDQKIMHALMLISRQQGIGKSLVGEIIGHGLWGEWNFSEVEHGHLDASFNSFLKYKKFILANEMLLSSSTAVDKRRDANLIKNAITRDRVEINEKYIRQFFVRDVLCWMLTSNFDDAVWLDREDDRRIHITRLKQTIPLSKALGEAFAADAKKWAQSKEGASAINYYFLNYPCDGFSAKAPPPTTEGQRIVYEMGLSILERFVRDLIENPQRLVEILGDEKLRGADLVRLDDIRKAFLAKYEDIQTVSDQAISSAISRFGGCYIPNKIQWTEDQKQCEARTWALRNAEYWQAASPKERAAHYLNPVNNPKPEPDDGDEEVIA
ncbi:MAG: hypothetical protein JO138_07275 [Acidobacteriaceae bacterium]|nr:hypothetical protein [Acidobacteriaceae bacterium]